MKKKGKKIVFFSLPISLVFFQNSGEMNIYRYFLGSMICMTSVDCFLVMVQSGLCRESGQELRAQTWRKDLKQRPGRSTTYRLTLHSHLTLLSFFFFYFLIQSQSHLPRSSSVNNGLGPHLLKYVL